MQGQKNTQVMPKVKTDEPKIDIKQTRIVVQNASSPNKQMKKLATHEAMSPVEVKSNLKINP